MRHACFFISHVFFFENRNFFKTIRKIQEKLPLVPVMFMSEKTPFLAEKLNFLTVFRLPQKSSLFLKNRKNSKKGGKNQVF